MRKRAREREPRHWPSMDHTDPPCIHIFSVPISPIVACHPADFYWILIRESSRSAWICIPLWSSSLLVSLTQLLCDTPAEVGDATGPIKYSGTRSAKCGLGWSYSGVRTWPWIHASPELAMVECDSGMVVHAEHALLTIALAGQMMRFGPTDSDLATGAFAKGRHLLWSDVEIHTPYSIKSSESSPRNLPALAERIWWLSYGYRLVRGTFLALRGAAPSV